MRTDSRHFKSSFKIFKFIFVVRGSQKFGRTLLQRDQFAAEPRALLHNRTGTSQPMSRRRRTREKGEGNVTFLAFQKVVLLQNLVKSKGIIWGSLFAGSPSVFQDMSSLVVEITKLKSDQTYNLHFPPKDKPHPSWLSDRISVRVDTSKFEASPKENFVVVVAAYRNLTQFLKARYLTKFE